LQQVVVTLVLYLELDINVEKKVLNKFLEAILLTLAMEKKKEKEQHFQLTILSQIIVIVFLSQTLQLIKMQNMVLLLSKRL